MVKPKTEKFQIFKRVGRNKIAWVLPLFSLLTFISSWLGVYPPAVVEQWYARAIFPKVSFVAGRFGDSVSFSWLDAAIPLGAITLLVTVRTRQWRVLLGVIAGLYLIFFWTWGLNYHRMPLNSKLQLDAARMEPEAVKQFTGRVAEALNGLYDRIQQRPSDELRSEAVRRVRRVVAVIDSSDWESASRIKVSRLTNPWLHAAGIDGLFNPLGHEPIVSDTILDVEWPFVIAHELAHVRGYPDEGDANLIATLATLMSDDPAFQYSGWLNLWLYLRTRELDELLEVGPRHDVQRVFERARAEQIAWVNDLQRIILDWFLKANSVDEGVRSYSRAALMAAGSEPFWERFR
jgi:hypothetical protein